MPTALILRQNVHLTLEISMRRDRARLTQHLPTLHLLFVDTTQECTDVVTRLALIEQLTEHLHTRTRRLLRLTQTNDLDLITSVHNPLLHLPGDNSATTRDREHILDRHQERLVQLTHRSRNRRISSSHQLHHLLLRISITLQRLQRRHMHHRSIITRELILAQQLAHLELHQLEQFFVVDHVRLVQRTHDVRNTHLTRQQHMLTRLRHRTIRRRHHQNRTIHLRGTGDHVLDVISMTRHIDMRVMTILRLVLDMGDRDRDTTRLLLRRLVNPLEISEIRQTTIRQRLGDRSRERGLAMVNMTHGPNVDVRLVPLELLFTHCTTSLFVVMTSVGFSRN